MLKYLSLTHFFRGYAKGTRDNKSSEVNELEREKRKIEVVIRLSYKMGYKQ